MDEVDEAPSPAPTSQSNATPQPVAQDASLDTSSLGASAPIAPPSSTLQTGTTGMEYFSNAQELDPSTSPFLLLEDTRRSRENRNNSQEHNAKPLSANLSENAIPSHGGPSPFSRSNFDSLGAPMHVTPGGGSGILSPTSNDLNGNGHARGDYLSNPLLAQANGNDTEETIGPRRLDTASSGQAVPVVRPGPSGNVPPAGSSIQNNFSGVEISNLPTNSAGESEGEAAEQQKVPEEDFSETIEMPDLNQPMTSPKALRPATGGRGVRKRVGMIPAQMY
ncbi:hypothetical protein DL98DRAFT_513642 [Cadophora sp. DSE1049]|nr:hypothetical protein DL98DRAFT_513642 [Cadophora sp. DSE1049]